MIILLTGLPGTGKTEVARFINHKIPDSLILRNDEIRKELFDVEGGKGFNEDQKTLMDETIIERATQVITKKQTVILDRVSPTIEGRQKISNLADSLGTKFILIKVSSSQSRSKERIECRLNNDPLGIPFSAYSYWLEKYEPCDNATYELTNNESLDDLEKSIDMIVAQLK